MSCFFYFIEVPFEPHAHIDNFDNSIKNRYVFNWNFYTVEKPISIPWKIPENEPFSCKIILLKTKIMQDLSWDFI